MSPNPQQSPNPGNQIGQAVAANIPNLKDLLLAPLKGLAKGLGKVMAPLGKIAKQANKFKPMTKLGKAFGNSKVGKGIKAMGGMVNSLAKASIQAWAIEQLINLLGPFLKLLELLEIPISILSAMLEMLVAQVLVALLPYILDFSNALMELMPIFVSIGAVVAKTLKPVFAKLIPILKMVVGALAPFLTQLMDQLGPVLTILGQVVGLLLAAFAPLISQLLDALLPVIMDLLIAFGPLLLVIAESLIPLIEQFSSLLLLLTPVIVWVIAVFSQLFALNVGAKIGLILGAFQVLVGYIQGAIATVEFVALTIGAAFISIKQAWEDSGEKLFGPDGWIMQAFDGLKLFWAWVTGKASFEDMFTGVIEVYNNTLAKLFGEDGILGSAFSSLGKFVSGIVGNYFGKDGKVMAGFHTMVNGFIIILNSAIGLVNGFITKINDTLGTNIATIGTIGLLGEESTGPTSLEREGGNRIAALATGGLATAPTLAMVGDNPNVNSDPEVISPLSKLKQMGLMGENSEEMIMTQEETNQLLRLLIKKMGDNPWQV